MPRRARKPRLWPWIIVIGLSGMALCPLASARLASAAAALGRPSSALPTWQQPLLAAYLIARQNALDSQAGESAAVTTLEVEPGETASEVVNRLARAGIVEDPALLRTYLVYRGLDVAIEAGRYTLRGDQTLREIAAALQRAADSRYTLVIPEGWRREEIAQALGGMGLSFTPGDFLAATRREPPWNVGGSPTTLEGFLFPDSYRLDPRWSAEDVADLMLEGFARRVDAETRQAFDQRGLSLLSAVTLASIVEREAALAEERPLIASVFLNRLAMGMKLQADPTVQHAMGLQPDGSWWKSPLTATDLGTDSPYNTYVYAGLPPAPIANPGLASLRAVAFPAATPYYYFRTACDSTGAHLFAETFEEHLHNGCP